MSNEGLLKFVRNNTEKDLVTVIHDETVDKVSVNSQVLTDEQKTQAQTNVGDPFLPLSGGTVTGRILGHNSDDYKMLEITGGDTYSSGATVRLHRNNDPNSPSAFHISTGNQKFLSGLITGSLLWEGKEIERVSQVGKGVDLPDGSSQHYIRFESGLQLVFGTAIVNGVIEEQKRVNLIVPFISNAIVVASNDANIGPDASVCVGWQDTTGFSIGTNLAGVVGHCRWIAIGFWK